MNLDPFYPQSSEFRESASPQDLHVELVRHYADVLRMLTERICPTPSVSTPVRPVPEDPPPSPEIVKDEGDCLMGSKDIHSQLYNGGKLEKI